MGDIARTPFATRMHFSLGEKKLIIDNGVLRNSILIKNLGPGILFVDGCDSNNLIINGYPLYIGEVLSIGMQERSPQDPARQIINLWGYCSDTAGSQEVELAILTEIN